MNFAEASLEERGYYLILAEELHYRATLMNTIEEVNRLLDSYTAAILNSGS